MNRRTFFHSLLGLMAIPFMGLKAFSRTQEDAEFSAALVALNKHIDETNSVPLGFKVLPEPIPPFILSDADARNLILSPQEFSKRYIQRAIPHDLDIAESDLHRQYRTGELGKFSLWHTGELGTVETIIIDEDTNVGRSI